MLSLNLNTSLYSTDYYDFPYEYNIYAGVYGGGWSGCYTTDIEGIGAYIDSPKENKSGGIFYAPCNPETYRLLCSLCGVIFQDDKIYKPIIKDGYVSGYTDNLTAESDIDNYTYDSGMGHEVPDKKPDPNLEDDNSDDINFGYAFSGAGAFTNLWYCTQKDLADLRQWFLGADAQHPIPEGFDPMPSIIGLFQYPISLGGDVLEEIKFRTSSGLIVSTGVQAARGLSTNLKFDLGSINIPARMRERGVPFLDYESTVECYVPFCGVFQLDTQTVIGKTLSCTLWMSPATGECNCIVYTISNGIKAPVAYGSGNMSSQIPISSNGWGSYTAALKNATIQKN